MKITLQKADPAAIKTPVSAVLLFEDDLSDLSDRPDLAGLKNTIAPRLVKKDFTPKFLSSMILFPDGSETGPERLILVGLGESKACSPEKVRQAVAKAIKEAMTFKVGSGALVLPPLAKCQGEPEDLVEAAALGAELGQYRFTELKTKKEELEKVKPLDSLTLVLAEGEVSPKMEAAIPVARITAEAVSLARDLVNRPGSMVYPQSLAEEAERLAGELGLDVQVYDVEAAKKKGMGSFLGVAQGSTAHPGRVIVLQYNGAGPDKEPLAIVGKAITFDSGGLCIKSGDNMKTMKNDMAGGAVTLAVLSAAARLKLDINLVGVVPAAENMPSGEAYRPGDVLKSLSGQTIEVINTDAEGRLILADGLTLANEFKPKAIIDLATLTGACVIALGVKCAGLFSNDDALSEDLLAASRATGEKIWRLPLIEEYAADKLKSDVADFKHTGGREASSITAALFLEKFVAGTPWAHLDIAGTATTTDPGPDMTEGGTGFGVHLLLRYLRGV